MAGRDEWFEIHTSEAIKPDAGAVTHTTSGFFVDPDAAPAMKAGFEQAIVEMNAAREAAREFNRLRREAVNPVVDKYMDAMIDRATGEEGSVTFAVNSAISEYQSVIEQLDAAMAGYRSDDNSAEQTVTGQA